MSLYQCETDLEYFNNLEIPNQKPSDDSILNKNNCNTFIRIDEVMVLKEEFDSNAQTKGAQDDVCRQQILNRKNEEVSYSSRSVFEYVSAYTTDQKSVGTFSNPKAHHSFIGEVTLVGAQKSAGDHKTKCYGVSLKEDIVGDEHSVELQNPLFVEVKEEQDVKYCNLENGPELAAIYNFRNDTREITDKSDEVNVTNIHCATTNQINNETGVKCHWKPPNKSLHECRTFSFCASTKNDLKRLSHFTNATLSDRERHRCKLCDYSAALRGNLVRHAMTHTGLKPFKCKICNYSTTIKCNLVRHIKIHANHNQLKCEFCDYRTTKEDNFGRHIKIHTGGKPFQCELCDYSSSRKDYWQQHYNIHTGAKPYKCEICDYSATRKIYLIQHSRTHTGAKPFKCEICDYNASRKGNLIQHINIHTGEKPFKCEICYYSSSRKDTLVQHIKTHIAEKPFKCGICDYSVLKKSNLIRHVQTHTS